MPEYVDKASDEKMEAFNDRTKRTDFPYVLEYTEEARIYQKMLNNASVPEVHVEPHTLEMSGLFGVMTRLTQPDRDDITLVQKAKAYDANDGEGEGIDVDKLREEAEDEGMYGVSARFIGDEIADAIISSLNKGSESLSPLTVFRHFEKNLESHASIPAEEYDDYYQYLEAVREEYERRAIEDVRHALAYNSDEIQRQGEKYMDNVMAYIDDDTIEDDLTGQLQEPDETFMRSVEEELEIPDDRKDDFRQEVSNWVSRRARRGESFNPHDNEKLLRALERKIWNDKKHNINFSALIKADSDDAEDDERNAWVEALVERGYSPEGAREVLEFAGAKVARAEMDDA
jgi:serine protein kinase